MMKKLLLVVALFAAVSQSVSAGMPGSNGGGIQSQASKNMDACRNTGGKWVTSSPSSDSDVVYTHCVCPSGSSNGSYSGGNYCVINGKLGSMR